jgi:phosphoglycolate phosphatase
MSEPSPSPTIVFDLDGTLVDTAPDLIDSLNLLLVREGVDTVAYEDARRLIGGGARLLIERGLTSRGRSFTPADIDRLYRVFVDDYASRIAALSQPFPGLEDALDAIAGLGCRLAVCTNKTEGLSVKLLNELNLSWRFAVICGQDTFGIMKPDPRILLSTIEAAGGVPASTLMIGDSITDIETARNAGVPVVAVDFGYTDVPVSRLGPDRVISRFDQLPALVDEMLRSEAFGVPVA